MFYGIDKKIAKGERRGVVRRQFVTWGGFSCIYQRIRACHTSRGGRGRWWRRRRYILRKGMQTFFSKRNIQSNSVLGDWELRIFVSHVYNSDYYPLYSARNVAPNHSCTPESSAEIIQFCFPELQRDSTTDTSTNIFRVQDIFNFTQMIPIPMLIFCVK